MNGLSQSSVDRHQRIASLSLSAITVLVLVLLSGSQTARAAALRPHWTVIETPAPTYFQPGDEDDFYEVVAVNDGTAPTDGSTFTINLTLPTGVSATESFGDAVVGSQGQLAEAMTCTTSQRCTSSVSVPVGELVKMKVLVSVDAKATGGLASSVTISGGGAGPAVSNTITRVSSAPVPFGASLSSDIVADGGESAVQAGSHPANFTTITELNIAAVNKTVTCPLMSIQTPVCAVLNADAKDIEVALPPGMVGDPTAIPRCSQTAFQMYGSDNCPADTQVGVLHAGFYGSGAALQYAPVYNVEPPPGQPAELGFTVGGLFHIPIYFRVRGDGDYALVADIANISEGAPVQLGALIIWGLPASPIHDTQRRGVECAKEGCSVKANQRPFLTLPPSCAGGGMAAEMTGDSWQEPGTPGNFPSLFVAEMPDMIGCGALSFAPSIAVAVDNSRAGVPAGYSVELKIPQNSDPEGLATPDVRDVRLTLPQGTVLSPSAANGLAACSEAQFELRSGTEGHCPPRSKIGQVSIATPLLEDPLHGSVFLGSPECAPCTPQDAQNGKLAPLLVEADGSGIVIKLEGHTSVDQTSGRLTTTFTENPQLPFSVLNVTLKGGDNAPLVNPTSCDGSVSTAEITPWSTLAGAQISAQPVPISECSSPTFAPSLGGGTVTAQAGAYSPFVLGLSRADGEQALGSLTVHMPPGLLGMLSTVARCDEARSNAGTCPETSVIGSATTTIGPGSRPLTITGGKVYLTGPYEGRPFGLSVVVPTEAGPFQLAGNTGAASEVVRASISVDPQSAAVTISSGAFPAELDGIPLDIRAINVDIDRSNFIFNPTNCAPLQIRGTVLSTGGSTASVLSPFQAVNCAMLPFSPSFTVSTGAKTSKALGASLHVKIRSGHGQANIGMVKVALPKQLPSRLTTLQKACVARLFETNPALCPAGSVVGTAKAVTPVLNGPLSGPAYLVSHGGAAFPDLEIVLQGEGITLILDGKTNIKKGITSSTFTSIPDAPISTFDLLLPEGQHSVLAANLPRRVHGSMCGQKLSMPTVITGQNGAVSKRATVVSVAGCSR